MSRAELVLYATEGGTVWLTQLELAELFQTTKQEHQPACAQRAGRGSRQARLDNCRRRQTLPPGRMSHQVMTAIAHERYEQFDAARRRAEALEADREELRELEQVEKEIVSRRDKSKGGKDVA